MDPILPQNQSSKKKDMKSVSYICNKQIDLIFCIRKVHTFETCHSPSRTFLPPIIKLTSLCFQEYE